MHHNDRAHFDGFTVIGQNVPTNPTDVYNDGVSILEEDEDALAVRYSNDGVSILVFALSAHSFLFLGIGKDWWFIQPSSPFLLL